LSADGNDPLDTETQPNEQSDTVQEPNQINIVGDLVHVDNEATAELSTAHIDHVPAVPFVDDVGRLINATMSVQEITCTVKSLDTEHLYHLLRNHRVPSEHFTFPSCFLAGNNRSFQRKWLTEFPWLVYSEHLDGSFCLPCCLFGSNRESLGVLVNRPFTKWHKKTEVLNTHAKMSYHQQCVELSSALRRGVEAPSETIPVIFDTKKRDNIEKNRHIVKCIAECILLCSRQCIALRGDHETGDFLVGNPGNFRAILNMIAEHDTALKEHLQQPAMKNCRYIYHRTSKMN